MSLGKRVEQLMIKKNMNQKKLADASEITQATISRILSGQVKELKPETLKRLAKALGTTVDYLVGKTERMTESDILESDEDAQYIFRGYEKLSAKGRAQLKDFVRFLEQQQKDKPKGKS